MSYICTKAMKIMRGGIAVDVKPGDPVPEAASWQNPAAWEAQGYIRFVGDAIAKMVGKKTTPPTSPHDDITAPNLMAESEDEKPKKGRKKRAEAV